MRRGPLAVLAVIAASLALAGCDAVTGEDDPDTHLLEVRGTHTGFDMDVPQDWAITDVWDADVCGSVSYRIASRGRTRLVVEAVPTQCAEAAENTQIGNGMHGVYRTIDDVPEPRDQKAVDTALGEATVFSQEYFECTNSCEDWNEPVAIITLAVPVDAGYPTLVVRGEKASVSRAELEEVVASLAAPYAPTG